MRLSQLRPLSASLLMALPYYASALSVGCEDIVQKGERYDLGKLKGPHHVSWLFDEDDGRQTNWTFGFDICGTLKLSELPKKNRCKLGSYVCGIHQVISEDSDKPYTNPAVNIAGEYIVSNGKSLNPEWSRLQDSESNADSEREGLRLKMEGGSHPLKGKNSIPQKAIFEFVCDMDRTGLEDGQGFDIDFGSKQRRTASETGTNEDDDSPSDKSLRFVSYKPQDSFEVLRVEWRTRYACKDQVDNGGSGGGDSSHWGFFTWLLIIVFLGVATYLIFGSWLNYNRYGARGWDLVPHGDTIRDIPYILKDMGRSVVNTVSGPGPRGGYSAV